MPEVFRPSSNCSASTWTPWTAGTAISPFTPTTTLDSATIELIQNTIDDYRSRFLVFDALVIDDLFFESSIQINMDPNHKAFINDPIIEEQNCANGLDDDMDGVIDCAESRCAANADNCKGTINFAIELCYDGIDNDGNGDIDCADVLCVNAVCS